MKYLLPILVLLSLAVPAVADEAPNIVGIGIDKGSMENILGWLKTLAAGGGGAGVLALLQKFLQDKKPQPGPTPSPDNKFDPSVIIDKLKDLLDGKTDPQPGPNPLPFPVPSDLQRFLDFISQTKALAEDVKTKGQPVGVKADFVFADQSIRTVEIGTRATPGPKAA